MTEWRANYGDAINEVCPRCGAESGAQCVYVWSDAYPKSHPHPARVEAAKEQQ